MKKIVSLIAAVSMLFALSVSAFAYTGNVSSGATISGNAITATGEFVFKYVSEYDIMGGSSLSVDVSPLINAGWTVTNVNGAFTEMTGSINANINSSNLLQVMFNDQGVLSATGKAILMFKATPSASATGTSFTVTPMVMTQAGGFDMTGTTYTLAVGASKDESVTVNGTDVVTVTYGDDATDRNLEGQTIVKGDLGAKTVTKDTKFKVTYNGVTRTFNLWGELGFVGSGELTADDITIGVAFRNAVSASEVQFEVE